MTDRRSQYEGIEDTPDEGIVLPPPIVDPPPPPSELGYQRIDLERKNTPPFAVTKDRSDSPATISTGTGTAKVHGGTTPTHVVHPEPKSEQIYFEDRDPTRMNELVKVEFGDVFAEPAGTRSFDQIWKVSFLVFNSTKFWCYRILSAVFAIPCALCWGINFACLQFDYIWCIQPYLKVFAIKLKPISVIWSACLRAIIDPLFESCGKILSNIKIKVNKEQ